jgi:acyl carrier protein
VEEIPAAERERLEKQIFHRGIEEVWADTVAFFTERDPEQITRANQNPKRKMALIFRWYLGLSSRWSNVGEKGREIDYQIWCGPAMGAFNSWVRGSYLEQPENRSVVDVAHHIMTGAAYLYRLQSLKMQGLEIPTQWMNYQPQPIPAPQSAPAPVAPAVPVADGAAHVRSETPAPAPAVSRPAAAQGGDKDVETIQEWLVIHLAERLATDPEGIDIREPFSNYNLDSAQVLVLASELEEWLGSELSPTLLWNYPTIEALAQRLATMQTTPPVGVQAGE